MSFSYRYFAHTFALAIAAALSCVQSSPAQTGTGAKPDVKEPYPGVKTAAEQFNQRNVDGARKTLENERRVHPELPPADLILFKWFADVNQANMARMELERAVMNSPSDPEAFVLLGNIALQERRVTEADMDFGKAKELLASFSVADRKKVIETQTVSGLASVAEAREQWKIAEKYLDDLMKIAPKDVIALQRQARARFWLGDPGEAYKLLKQAKAIDKENKENKVLTPEALLAQMYDAFEGEGSKTGNAEKWYRNALKAVASEKGSEQIPTRQVVALWALSHGKVDFAKEQSDECLKIAQGSIEAQILRGVIALWEKDYKTAEQYFQKAHIQSPINFAAKNNLALALCEQGEDEKEGPGKLDQALGYALPNYQENPKNVDALSTLGWVYYKRKQFDQAGLALQQALQASGGNMSSDTACYLAHVLFQIGKNNEAKGLLDAILDVKTSKPFSMRKEAEALKPKVDAELAKKAKEATPPSK